MNLKDIKKGIIDIEKSHWHFISNKKYNSVRFKKVKSKMGPSVFALDIDLGIYKKLIITNNSMSFYVNRKKCFSVGKEYTKEDFFSNSMLYELPSPEELKEIRKYFKKNHKNDTVSVAL